MSSETDSRCSQEIREFFACSSWLDYFVLKPLSHIATNWQISWNHDEKRYAPEAHSFADELNRVIELIASCPRPSKYHEHEDLLAEVVRRLGWSIRKEKGKWIGEEYPVILEQGAFEDVDQRNLIAAAAGRVYAALDHNQKHFDEMEEGHFHMLAALMSIIIYHRLCDGEAVLIESGD